MKVLSNNINTIRFFLFLIFLFFGNGIGLIAQTTLQGKVMDIENGKELKGVVMIVTKKGNLIQKKKTDENGNYKINIDPGEYELTAAYGVYPRYKIEDIIAIENQDIEIDIELNVHGCDGVYRNYRKPILKKHITISGRTITTVEILDKTHKNFPIRDLQEIIIQTPGVSWQK